MFTKISNFFYTKPTDPKVADFKYKDTEGNDQNGASVTVAVGKVSRTVIFDPEKKNYQILKPSGLNLDQRAVVLNGKETEFVSSPVTGSINLKSWLPIKGEALADDNAAKIFASNVVEQSINFKAVRFFRWSAQSISNKASNAYKNLNINTVFQFTAGALVIGSLGYLFMNNQSACETKLKEIQAATIHKTSWIGDAILYLRSRIGF